MRDLIKCLDGWMNDDEVDFLYDFVELLPTGSVIVEIGAWLGKSTIALAHTKRHKVITIDTWHGQPDLRDTTHKLAKEVSLRDKFIETVLKLFLIPSEFQSFDACNNGLYYIAGDSGDVYTLFPDNSIDFWFHDGDHNTVGRDIDLWKPKLKQGGILAGHDYGSWEHVTRDVDARVDSIEIHNTIWVKRFD